MSKSVQITQSLRAWMDVFMHRSMRGWSRFVKTTGLSMQQFSVLMQLHYKGPCGMSELNERGHISAAAASQLVEKLVQSDLIEREEDPNDRRAKQLSLSRKGAQLVEQGIEERHRWMDDLALNISPEEGALVVEALEILVRAAGQLDEKI
ncbi:MAG: MarR family transcriptional regulator [Chloroflexi bacterium]|nr:MarR family transcriptional regulator [Chloroflexota bacterium]